MHPYAALKKGWVGLLAHHHTLKTIPAGGLVETRPDTKKKDSGWVVLISQHVPLKRGNCGWVVLCSQHVPLKKGLNG